MIFAKIDKNRHFSDHPYTTEVTLRAKQEEYGSNYFSQGTPRKILNPIEIFFYQTKLFLWEIAV